MGDDENTNPANPPAEVGDVVYFIPASGETGACPAIVQHVHDERSNVPLKWTRTVDLSFLWPGTSTWIFVGGVDKRRENRETGVWWPKE